MSRRTKTPLTARTRASFLSGTTALAVVGVLLLPVGPAAANELQVTDPTSLEQELSLSGTADTVELGQDITFTGILRVQRDVTVDLNGKVLATESVLLAPNVTLTIDDSSGSDAGTWSAEPTSGQPGFRNEEAHLVIVGGTVIARGSDFYPGIGGGLSRTAGTVTVYGGSVTARGGFGAAGIGGGDYGGAGGTTNVYGGNLTATGGFGAAGIGGGNDGSGGTTTIHGGYVAATGGSDAAGIGGGFAQSGGITTIYGGSVEAQGGFGAAGIGGGAVSAGASTAIHGGNVWATGGESGAGIGGGINGSGHTTRVYDGSVEATGGIGAAGIGGGERGNAGAITVNGGIVTAIGGPNGAGIGSGVDAFGGTIAINSGTVVATGGTSAPGIGSASPTATALTLGSATISTSRISAQTTIGLGSALTFSRTAGTMITSNFTNNGALTLTGNLTVQTTGLHMLNSGHIEGPGSILGSGILDNLGVICAPIEDRALSTNIPPSGLNVRFNAYYLSVDQPGLGVIDAPTYSPRYGDCGATLPDVSTSSAVNVGWGVNGEEPLIGDNTFLFGIASLANGTPGTLEPVFADPVLTVDPTPTSSVAGVDVPVTVRGPLALSNELSSDLTDRVEFTGDGIEPGSTPGTFRSTTAGVSSVTALIPRSLFSNGPTLATTFTHTTTPAPLDRIEATPDTATVEKTESVTFDVTGFDAFDNPITINPDDVTITSDNPFDLIDGQTVAFPFAGDRTLTITASGVDTTVSVTVTTPDTLPAIRVDLDTPAAAGEPVTTTITLEGVNGDIDITDAVTSITGPGLTQLDDGRYVFEQAGEIELTITAEGTTFTTSVFVTPGPLTELQITPSASTVKQGQSITLTVTGQDAFGHPIKLRPADIMVTSSVPTDIINGLTITFPTASPHTITVTIGTISASTVITVEPAAIITNPGTPTDTTPAPIDTADTGNSLQVTGPADTTPLGALALLLLTLGTAAILGSRRTRIHNRT